MAVIILPSPYPYYSTINMVIFNVLAFLAYASHIRTMFSDPVIFVLLFSLRVWVSVFDRAALSYCFSCFVWPTGSCSERKRHQRDDSTVGLQRRPSIFQVSEMLQHQTGTSPSLLRVSAMHTKNGPSLSLVSDSQSKLQCNRCDTSGHLTPTKCAISSCNRVNNCVGENNQKYFVLFTVSKWNIIEMNEQMTWW